MLKRVYLTFILLLLDISSLPPVSLTGSLTPNTILTKAEKLYEGQIKGPESVLVKHGKK